MEKRLEQFGAWLAQNLPQASAENEPLWRHSTFRIGGNARYAVFAQDAEMLLCCVRQCRAQGIPYLVVGNGSNLLFDDAGYAGTVIFTGKMNRIDALEHGRLRAEAGASLSALCAEAQQRSLAGLAFACGIPGTVGGAVYMNAGAYGGEMAQAVCAVRAYDPVCDAVRTYDAADCDFAYRHSIFQDSASGQIILDCTVGLVPGDGEQIRAQMQEYLAARKEKQPLEYPSAGSVFKRYPGYYTAQLIDQAGLRGMRVGGAQVSEKHAGFIVNRGGATARDVLELIGQIQDKIDQLYGIRIACEIKYIRSPEQTEEKRS